MLIVDGQIHLWEKGTPSPPHREAVLRGASNRRYGRGRRGPGVDPSVLWDPDSNELAIEAVRKYPNRFAIMGWF
jgi:hypothetical protein